MVVAPCVALVFGYLLVCHSYRYPLFHGAVECYAQCQRARRDIPRAVLDAASVVYAQLVRCRLLRLPALGVGLHAELTDVPDQLRHIRGETLGPVCRCLVGGERLLCRLRQHKS